MGTERRQGQDAVILYVKGGQRVIEREVYIDFDANTLMESS